MKPKIVLVLIGLVAAAGSYLAGRLPERRATLDATRALDAERARADQAVADLRLWHLLDRLDAVRMRLGERNFGLAQQQSSQLFDEVRVELGRAATDAHKSALDDLLAERDTVTAAIARSDPAVADRLWHHRERLRRALGRQPLAAPAEAATTPAVR